MKTKFIIYYTNHNDTRVSRELKAHTTDEALDEIRSMTYMFPAATFIDVFACDRRRKKSATGAYRSTYQQRFRGWMDDGFFKCEPVCYGYGVRTDQPSGRWFFNVYYTV